MTAPLRFLSTSAIAKWVYATVMDDTDPNGPNMFAVVRDTIEAGLDVAEARVAAGGPLLSTSGAPRLPTKDELDLIKHRLYANQAERDAEQDRLRAVRPALLITYPTKELQARVYAMAARYHHDTAVADVVRALMTEGVKAKGQTNESLSAIEKRIPDSAIRFRRDDSKPLPRWLTTKVPQTKSGGERGRTGRPMTVEHGQVTSLAVAPSVLRIIGVYAAKYHKDSRSLAFRHLLAGFMKDLDLAQVPNLVLAPGPDEVLEAVSIHLPTALMEQYEAAAALIGPRKRSHLMRHALLVQLKRELQSPSPQPPTTEGAQA